MKRYFENSCITVHYEEVNHILISTWKAPFDQVKYIEGKESMIAATRKFKVVKCVADVTHARLPDTNDLEISVIEWYKNAAKIGEPYVAVVLPHDIPTQIIVENALNALPIRVDYFFTMKAALNWIKLF